MPVSCFLTNKLLNNRVGTSAQSAFVLASPTPFFTRSPMLSFVIILLLALAKNALGLFWLTWHCFISKFLIAFRQAHFAWFLSCENKYLRNACCFFFISTRALMFTHKGFLRFPIALHLTLCVLVKEPQTYLRNYSWLDSSTGLLLNRVSQSMPAVFFLRSS